MTARVLIERAWLAGAACVTLAILGFYAHRLLMPLPIFAPDEGAYLIRALYPDPVVANNPAVPAIANGVHLSVIRAVHALGAPYIIGDRIANAAAYLGGLVLLWWGSTRRLPRAQQVALLLIAMSFSYYRFAFSNLAEGLFVGVLALLCVATGRWYRARPIVHALAAGALAAMLVLVKPHGMAVVAALAALAGLDALVSRDWRRLPIRVVLFAIVFFALGNLIQIQADAPPANPLTFFLGDFYAGAMALKPPPGATGLGVLAMVSMSAAMAVLTGAPLVIAGTDLFSRWRAARGRFTAEGADLVLLLLVLSLAATLVMVTLFAMKVAGLEIERKLLWGRYFEFYAPMIWLAAAPALARPISERVRLAAAGVMLVGLAVLIASLHTGIVLFPWDSSVLMAFFHADPVRAPMGFWLPYRALAITATVLAVAAVALRVRVEHAGLGLILGLSAPSTWQDHQWLGPIITQHEAMERDFRALRPGLPADGDMVVLAPDPNVGHLVFLRLDARPRIHLGPPGETPPNELTSAVAVLVAGPETPPGGPWARTYKGEEFSVFRPARLP
jgi:hypothetical protein